LTAGLSHPIAMDADRFLLDVTHRPEYRGQIAASVDLPPREARYASVTPDLPEPLLAALRADGIERLYTHQAQAVDAVRAGRNIVVVTTTASGKTLCYNTPVLETLLADPSRRALYLFPTKALAQDQLKTLQRYGQEVSGLSLNCGTYDGDTPQSKRRTLREKANILLSNPDMLHSGILPNHARWAHFFANLRYVVVDELHTYRGIFGSNVALLLRRLRRICRHYDADPVFICCSGTIGNPQEHAEALTGVDMQVLDDDGSPSGAKKFVLWNPPITDAELGVRRSPNLEAQWLMTLLIAEYQAPTIAFMRARMTAELLYRFVREQLDRISPRLATKVRSYRGGYLPEDRREIERQLFSGELLGVISTNALELGIDIGSLDAALIVGYPGSIASTWQQAGRAGRRADQSLAMLIARGVPTDQFLASHPGYFFGRSHERAVIDPQNAFVLAGHLRCALQEYPVDGGDLAFFGPLTSSLVRLLEDEGEAKERGGRWYWHGPSYPAGDINLRNADANNYVIQDATDGGARIIGMVDEWSAFVLLHDEAVYLHDGDTYFVQKLDLEKRVAFVEKRDLDYYTVAVDKTTIHLVDDENDPRRERPVGNSRAGLSPAEVSTLVYMFRKIKFYQQDSIGYGNLALPVHELLTEAAFIAPTAAVLKAVRDGGRQPEEGLLGVSNALSGVLPALVMCDASDVGTVVDATNLGAPAVFLFDRFPGGVGYAQKAFEHMEQVLEAALELVETCPCEKGCPSCVGVPLPPAPRYEDIDSRGGVPDKMAALAILRGILGRDMGDLTPGEAAEIRAAAPLPTVLDEPGAIAPEPVQPLPDVRLPVYVEKEIRKRLKLWRVNRSRRPSP
jgi:DEAD/DEAH box helicase domain-containing protein